MSTKRSKGRFNNVNSSIGRTALVTAGVITLIIGGIFTGQGMNLIPGSFMTGSRMWFFIGLILAVLGIILVTLGLRRPRTGRPHE